MYESPAWGAAILCYLMLARNHPPATKFTHTPEMLSGSSQHSALPAQKGRGAPGPGPPFSPLGCQESDEQPGD